MRVVEVRRDDHREARLSDEPTGSLAKGSVRLRIDYFAITANNVSYAVYGDRIGYWNFFPTATPWGRVPAMGWAEIIESTHSDLVTGSRYFGWYPMADTVDIKVESSADGFVDIGEHRAGHAAIYRAFVETSSDPLYDAREGSEERQSLLRGLFLTSFLADEFLADPAEGNDPYFGAQTVLVLSASAKTAIGFAQRASARGLRVIGATSPRNRDFVATLPWYETVVTYDDVAALDSASPTVCVDVAGNPQLLSTVHDHFGDRLRHSMLIGISHHDAQPLPADHRFRGPEPTFFAAPTEIERRTALWGPAEFDQRAAAALSDFVDGSRSWLALNRVGSIEACAAWQTAQAGLASPAVGTVVSLTES